MSKMRRNGSDSFVGDTVVTRSIVYAQNRDVIESFINTVIADGITNVVSRFDYAYDVAGHRTERTDSGMYVATNNVFVYNPKSEIVGATLMNGTTTYSRDW